MKVSNRRTILVADDEPQNRALLRASLSGDYHVLEAETGDAALAALSGSLVDLVILDVLMPGTDGVETCRRIKAQTADTFLPVLLLTALGGQEERHRGLAAGADDFLTKPLDRRELLLRVGAFLRLREQEERIRHHVQELQERELLIRKQLEALHRLEALKDDLFSLVIHDLRNPLTGVVGYLDLLRTDLAQGALQGAIAKADRAAEAALHLEGLLEVALEVRRLEEATLPLEPQAVSLGALVRGAVATLGGAASARRVLLEVAVEGDDPTLVLDPRLTRRAVENLVANAAKFSPAGATVSVRVRRSGEGAILVEVADRGPGVPDVAKAHLFKKFATVEAPRGEERRGFGLGLHLVELVAKAHGAATFVRDRAEGGAVFGLSFPASRLAPAALEPERRGAAPGA